MSRELRFVLTLLASIVGLVVIVGGLIFLTRQVVRSAFTTSDSEKVKIATDIATVPKGYRVSDAISVLGSSWVQLISFDGFNVIEIGQSQGSVRKWGGSVRGVQERIGCVTGTFLEDNRVDAKWQDPTVRTYRCNNGAALGVGQFLSKEGRATLLVGARSGRIDKHALAEIFDSAGDIRPK